MAVIFYIKGEKMNKIKYNIFFVYLLISSLSTPAFTGTVIKQKPYVDLMESSDVKFPSVEDSVFVKSKYTPVEPRPYRIVDGNEHTTDTSNAQKAMYKFITGVKDVKDLDWAGHNIIDSKEKESFFQGSVRSALNTPGRAVADVITPVLSDKTAKKFKDATHKAYTDITERDTKPSALILGRILGGILLFLIPASIVRKQNKEIGKNIVVCGSIISILLSIFSGPLFSMIYIVSFVFFMILAYKIKE